VSAHRTRRFCWLILGFRYVDGREEEVTLDLTGLDHAPDEIAERIREVWRIVRAGEQAGRSDEPED
jgi:hypothetical protein